MFKNRECGYVQPLLWDHASGRLRESDGARVDAHLGRCATCRREAESFARTVQMVAADRQEGIGVPPAAWYELERSLVVPIRVDRSARRRVWILALGGAAFATILLFLTIHLASRQEIAIKPPDRPAQRSARISNSTVRRNQDSVKDSLVSPRHAPVLNRGTRPKSNAPMREPQNLQMAKTSGQLPSSTPDSIYLDGRDTAMAAYWAGGGSGAPASAKLPDGAIAGLRDDFVRIPLPSIAGDDRKAIAAAQRVQQEEAKIVDTRLFRKVTLTEKAVSLEDLCADIEKQTGVKLAASRGVRDEKVTVLVNDLPARDVMRAVARLFEYYWVRSGTEGEYEYVLKQDLRSQLAEEEQRNKDIDAALLTLDEAIAARPVNSPAVQAYLQLTPAERMALRAGKEIRFSTDQAIPAGFPAGWTKSLLESFGTFGTPSGSFTPAKTPGAVAGVTLSLVYSELGQVTLECQSDVNPPGLAAMSNLGIGRSPSAVKPDNRTVNQALESDPAFRAKVSLAPKPCSKPDFKTAYGVDFKKVIHIEDDLQNDVSPPTPHVNSSDVWEAVHDQSGLPIVADYYTHLYPADDFRTQKQSLFEALCQAGDRLGVRWKKDGDFLLCRSASFFWNKVKEVPNRLLDRWERDRERNDGIPLDDLLEMAMLTDQQLDSLFVGQGIKHCRNLMEWNILSNPEYAGMRRKFDTVRPMARYLASLPGSLRTRALSQDGIPVTVLNPAQQEALSKLIPTYGKPATYDGMRFRVEYVPSGRYYWSVVVNSQADEEKWLSNPPLVTGKTPEETLAAARQVYPDARPQDIRRSYGQLAMSLLFTDGSATSIGKRPPAVRVRP